MSVFDHEKIEGDHPNPDECVWCCEVWPCPTAQVLHEAAEKIREFGLSFDPDNEGIYHSASIIDPYKQEKPS